VKPQGIRLFIEAHCFDNEFQGTRTFIKELYKGFSGLTHKAEYFVAAKDVENAKREFDFLPNATFLQYRSGSSFLRLAFEIPAMLKKYKIDVAHFQYVAPFRTHCHYIVTTHDILFNDYPDEFSWLYRLSRNYLFKRSIACARFKTTVSGYSRRRISEHYHLKESEMSVIPNAVNDDFFADYDKVGAREHILRKFGIERYILYVSRIEPRKNNVTLLQAFLQSRLYERGYSLVFIGKTSIEVPALQQELKVMPHAARHHYHHIEQVNDIDLMRFYQGAEAFVYPSKAEGFGIPPLEAAALQVPVLCSNRTAMEDYDFFGPLFFDPDNVNQLAQKLELLLTGKFVVSRHEIARSISEKYSWKSSAGKLLALISEEFPDLMPSPTP
jgi:glycosyltransferase involved in cell wall biosynthesis